MDDVTCMRIIVERRVVLRNVESEVRGPVSRGLGRRDEESIPAHKLQDIGGAS